MQYLMVYNIRLSVSKEMERRKEIVQKKKIYFCGKFREIEYNTNVHTCSVVLCDPVIPGDHDGAGQAAGLTGLAKLYHCPGMTDTPILK